LSAGLLRLYTEHTDSTVFSRKVTEKLRPLRGIRVQIVSNLDFEKAILAEAPWIFDFLGEVYNLRASVSF